MRSLTNRLALLFAGITLLAVAAVYVGVVPSLRGDLQRKRLDYLQRQAVEYSGGIRQALATGAPPAVVEHAVRQAADAATARVTLFAIQPAAGASRLVQRADSAMAGTRGDLQFPVAQDAASTGRPQTATEAGTDARIAEAAEPVAGNVVVYSAPLEDVGSSVGLIRRRILVAGAVALMLAIAGGYLVALALSRRVKRLERVAGRVAAGDFSARFPVDSRDELGQLALALDDMQRQLSELDDARKRFIATASHELRTPIFSLGGFVELLQDEELSDEERDQFLRQLRDQVDRLQKLSVDLLDLSRLEAGSLELRPEETDIGDLARAVADEFTPALAAHEAHLELRLQGKPVRAVCDPGRVAQIMRILIDNALTHTPAGTDVVVAASQRDDRVRLSVTDYGEGIRRGAVGRIFEPFFTADDAQGSGLGLAIAHELATRMRGDLAVESVPGRTTFALELPA
ncbi:MAG TPA: HAMP domain-containing sensor histidine kinase [Solirubrobacteraceae bacterium]|nr:HAMP domain-containing sensor histidine kinase [Solirubrobacteraceae bacterium]